MTIKQIRMLPSNRQRTKARPHNSVAWREASSAFLARYPFCVLCLARGKINERAGHDECTTQRTLVVDHIEPHRGDERLFWDQGNWQTLCRLCHDIEKQRHEQRGGSGWQWRQMLMAELERTGSHAVWHQMKEHVPGGVWGSSSGVGTP